MLTGERSLFISSCTRRELARRRGTRGTRRTQVLITLIVLAAAFGAFAVAQGGL